MNPYDKTSINALIRFLDAQGNPGLGRNGRANLSELRRAAADPSDTRSIWILGPLLPERDGWESDAYRLAATLYAFHAQRFTTPDGGHKLPKFSDDGEPVTYKRRSFGESLRRLRTQLGAGEDSLDKRFVALLDTDTENLAAHLRGFIQRIASAQKDIPVDYGQLLTDLLNWNGNQQTLIPTPRRQWARDYWQPVTGEDDDEPFTTNAP